MRDYRSRDCAIISSIVRLPLAPERQSVLVEPGLIAWDQANGPTIGQGADMEPHGFILDILLKKSNPTSGILVTCPGSVGLSGPA